MIPLLLAQASSPTPAIRDIAAPLYVFPYPLWVIYTAVGIVLAFIALASDFDVSGPVTVGLCAIAVYIAGSDATIRLARSFSA